MKNFNNWFKGFKFLLVIILGLSLTGCAVMFSKTPPEEVKEAKKLKTEVEELSQTLEKTRMEKEREIQRLRESMASLQRRLQQEMRDKDVKLTVGERGLVITILDKILFDPGKAKLKPESFEVLEKVASVLIAELPDQNIGVEGHTDSQPIKYSGWKSNWELSTARALSVLHYFEEQGVEPSRLSAIGYGPYRPVATNATEEGRQKNRRVEIVVLPESFGIERELLEEAPYRRGIK